MAYVEHEFVKAAAVAAVAIEGEVLLPNLMQKETFDAYKGAKDDTVNFKVEGVLPWREYGWRNDRTKPIVFDTYKERTYGVSLGADIYSAVALTDEQYNLDTDGWSKLVTKQGEAVGRGVNALAVKHLTDDTNYDVKVGVSEDALRTGLVKVRQIAGRLHMPTQGRTLIVGTDWEAALLESDLLRNFNASEGVGESALREATIGRLYGFDVVVSQEIAPEKAIAMGASAFVFANAAPAVPQSVKFGATGSYMGVSTRLIQQYNHMYLQDESVLNTWCGFRTIRDALVGIDPATDQAYVTDKEYQVRAISLELNGTGAFSTGTATELGKITGLTSADLTVSAPTTTAPAAGG